MKPFDDQELDFTPAELESILSDEPITVEELADAIARRPPLDKESLKTLALLKSWTAKSHGEAYLAAVVQNSLGIAADSLPRETEVATRVREWSAKKAAKAGAAARVFIEAIENNSNRVARIVTDGLDSLLTDSGASAFAASGLGVRSTEHVRSTTSSVTSTDGNIRIDVKSKDGTITVLAHRLASWTTAPLVALVPLTGDIVQASMIQVLQPVDDEDPLILRAAFSVPSGDYLVVLESAPKDRTEDTQQLIANLMATLSNYSEIEYPVEWAKVQNKLGQAYRESRVGDRAANLLQSIGFLEAALRVYTRQDFPAEWAAIQANLGQSLHELSTGDRTENLHHAISCYREALRVYTENSDPVEFAETSQKLGAALGEIRERGQ
jgi:hypothetical protein